MRAGIRTAARSAQSESLRILERTIRSVAPDDLARMHGTNERVAVRDYEQAIRLYRQLIVNAGGG